MQAREWIAAMMLLLAACEGRVEDAGPGAASSGPGVESAGAPAVPDASAGARIPAGGAEHAAVPDMSPGATGAAALDMTLASPPPVAPAQGADMLALENQPGATPALRQIEVEPGPPHPGLSGAPGPSPAMGPASALVKVFVFSDFQCPVCRRIVEPLKQVARTHPDDLQVVFKHHALEMHRHARGAAIAAIAASRQGRFWQYHDKLFQNQDRLDAPDLLRYAEEVGLDVPRFQKDIVDPMVAAQVDYEGQMAERLGVRGTPGFFVNGALLAGWASYPSFEAMVDRALDRARQLAATGTPRPQVAQIATAAAGAEGKLLAEIMWGLEQ